MARRITQEERQLVRNIIEDVIKTRLKGNGVMRVKDGKAQHFLSFEFRGLIPNEILEMGRTGPVIDRLYGIKSTVTELIDQAIEEIRTRNDDPDYEEPGPYDRDSWED